MFYSHEVLTSRKYGVATVWLVATLGANSTSKKVNRKAISEVDVPKACRTIVNPAAPMALRLQGNLLYGVSRVYLQQCGYVLSDAQNAYNTMHLMLRAVKNAELDSEAGKVRPEQLLLQDDPSFLPEFALLPPELLAELDLGPPLDPIVRAGDSQSLTPFGTQHVPTTPEGPIGGLILPGSSSIGPGGFGIQGDVGPSSNGGPSGVPGVGVFEDVIDDPGFTFDDDGNLVDLTDMNAIFRTPGDPGGAVMPSDAGASARVRQEHEEGLRAGEQQLGDNMDFDLPVIGGDLPEGEAFPVGVQQQPRSSSNTLGSDPAIVAAVLRKKRATRTLPVDTTVELRNRDLADWNTNYLENMKQASHSKIQQLLSQQAKKNADFYVWGSGIGGIGARLPGVTGPTPFDMFAGDNLFELFTGIDRNGVARSKRDRDSGIDDITQEEARRVRQRVEEGEEQIGRGQEDEVMFIPGDDVELPRDAPVALDDEQVFSAMPWNSASVRGSSALKRSVRTGIPSSLPGPRRGTRMISASPLHGRGQPGELQQLEGFGEDEASFDNFSGFAGFNSEMPEAALAQPDARVRVREALSAEGENFVTFVADAIGEKRGRAEAALEPMSDVLQTEAAADIDEVLFDELIPTMENTKMVASQALMMTLTLATKGMLNVRQDGGFEEVGLSLTEKAKATLIVEPVEEGDREAEEQENDGGEEENEQGGNFEEQFAAGRGEFDEASGEEDSLYGD
ncbi:hypothetical protein P280DRAFT_552939 [Massarina eburnea CBS 473.64]|uniref:Rad21/Rec8-like protein N-terminal domain-containing protein n=1 Tax=Massarina eburnea CBS 473.64 TaxID=1395130 RepID=A0A6A6RPR6_9PLEO|nr:hypothetical protein P280DRAFT_552939 [Massarina eburnea CBS 473.64]